jgi:hypothetical protein
MSTIAAAHGQYFGGTDTSAGGQDVWAQLAPNPTVADALRSYAENKFVIPATLDTLPLADELFVEHWRAVIQRAAVCGSWLALSETILQLRFPVSEGMSATDAYRALITRGSLDAAPPIGAGAVLQDEDGVEVMLHCTAAGAIPVIICRTRADFETLVHVTTKKNEPVPVPPSMGACMVAGWNNWPRLAGAVQARVAQGVPAASAFAEVVPLKALYQDRFILLSRGAYSGVDARAMQMDEDAWLDRSVIIRREHEATHYFTKRVFGSMQNALLDEVLADYAGIVAARGTFCAEWFNRFMGVDDPRDVRSAGRLHNYRGTPPLSDEAFQTLARVVRLVSSTVEQLDRRWRQDNPHLPIHEAVTRLARLGVDGLLGGSRAT